MTPAESSALSMLLKPFFLLVALTALAFVRWLVMRWAPEGKLKRLLLKDV